MVRVSQSLTPTSRRLTSKSLNVSPTWARARTWSPRCMWWTSHVWSRRYTRLNRRTNSMCLLLITRGDLHRRSWSVRYLMELERDSLKVLTILVLLELINLIRKLIQRRLHFRWKVTGECQWWWIYGWNQVLCLSVRMKKRNLLTLNGIARQV